jgi:Protein-glutamine gamma-glutamyltransferase
MNMREYWAQEAAMMRDTSAVLGENVLEMVSLGVSKIKPIIVSGMNATMISKWVSELTSAKQKEIFKAMEEHPDLSFDFSSIEELKLHLAIREATIKRIIQLEKAWSNTDNAIANYPSGREKFHVPTDYWELINLPGENGAFITREGIDIAKSVNSLMETGNAIILDCNRMSVAIAYVGLLDIVGEEKFKKIFTQKSWITIGTWQETYDDYGRISLIKEKFYKREVIYKTPYTDDVAKLCLPGDVVYFRNSPVYKDMMNGLKLYVRNPNIDIDVRNDIIADERYDLAWAGEFCICVDSNSFAGFGLSNKNNPNNIGLSAIEVRKNLHSKSESLYALVKEKAKPILAILENMKAKPNLTDVIIDPFCYRLNTEQIIKKM